MRTVANSQRHRVPVPHKPFRSLIAKPVTSQFGSSVKVIIRGRALMCVESSVRLAIMQFETEGSVGLLGSQVILDADAV
jgi:hypothetical protein